MTKVIVNKPNGKRHHRRPVMHNLLNDFFNSSLSDLIGSDFTTSTPSINVIETKDAHRMEVAAPGLSKEAFDLNIDKDLFTISATVEATENEETDEKIIRREFNYGTFKRSFTLPDTVNKTEISAKYENGILVIHLPKKEEAKEVPPRKVEIS